MEVPDDKSNSKQDNKKEFMSNVTFHPLHLISYNRALYYQRPQKNVSANSQQAVLGGKVRVHYTTSCITDCRKIKKKTNLEELKKNTGKENTHNQIPTK